LYFLMSGSSSTNRLLVDRLRGGDEAALAELFSAATWLVVLGAVVLLLVCIVRGLEGERFKVPILGELTDKL